MCSTIHAAPGSAHLSRRERQRMRRAEAFSRRQSATPPAAAPVKLDREDLDLIEHLVRHERTVVSTALLVIAGIGAGSLRRREVLARVGQAACSARAEGVDQLEESRTNRPTRHARARACRPDARRVSGCELEAPARRSGGGEEQERGERLLFDVTAALG